VAILVANGIYRGTTLLMQPWVDIYGGFEPARWTRDVLANVTTLDGEQQRGPESISVGWGRPGR
jgi:hypothetical protein